MKITLVLLAARVKNLQGKNKKAFSTLRGLRGPSVTEPLLFLRSTASFGGPHGHPHGVFPGGGSHQWSGASGPDKCKVWCLSALHLDTDPRKGKRTLPPVFKLLLQERG